MKKIFLLYSINRNDKNFYFRFNRKLDKKSSKLCREYFPSTGLTEYIYSLNNIHYCLKVEYDLIDPETSRFSDDMFKIKLRRVLLNYDDVFETLAKDD